MTRTHQAADHVQVTHYLFSLRSMSMMSTQDFSVLDSHQALRNGGIAELWHISIHRAEGTMTTLSQCIQKPNMAHMQPQMLLSLVWPRYLEDLAASKTPITQVCNLLGSFDICMLQSGQGHDSSCSGMLCIANLRYSLQNAFRPSSLLARSRHR